MTCREKIICSLGMVAFFAIMCTVHTMEFNDLVELERHYQLTAAQKKAIVACWQE